MEYQPPIRKLGVSSSSFNANQGIIWATKRTNVCLEGKKRGGGGEGKKGRRGRRREGGEGKGAEALSWVTKKLGVYIERERGKIWESKRMRDARCLVEQLGMNRQSVVVGLGASSSVVPASMGL